MHIFNRVKFNTPESVELEFTLAGIGNRAWALLIDYLVLSVILILFLIAWITLSIQLADLWKSIFRDQAGFWLVAIAFLIGFAIYGGYFVFFETLWQGQTPGKRFTKIRVVRDDGRPIGLQQATLRALLRLFDEVLFIGAILIMFSNQEKRLGDLAAGTIVIQTQTPTTSRTLTISEQAKSLSEQLLQIADLSAMLPDDFAVIREYLYRRSAMAPKARTSVALQLAKDIKAIIHLENIPEAVTPDVLLEAIYLAYQKFSNFSHD
ncbi:RDD family protein [Brasilonema octagenarum UFV-E1]|uniref:RDD family protein n=1 Tax=Brasilonema sennae CENA114 TaxID=415709 RepID=A0A856MIE0_9CYAN|nr:RDD family protein [Brasilonema sennae]QDL11023.1 RDD family protein [Brasilonema sennae CENA114]QDL17368.1 RDD family protein [Brasilonema octagenarum UFV-E1]